LLKFVIKDTKDYTRLTIPLKGLSYLLYAAAVNPMEEINESNEEKLESVSQMLFHFHVTIAMALPV